MPVCEAEVHTCVGVRGKEDTTGYCLYMIPRLGDWSLLKYVLLIEMLKMIWKLKKWLFFRRRLFSRQLHANMLMMLCKSSS